MFFEKEIVSLKIDMVVTHYLLSLFVLPKLTSTDPIYTKGMHCCIDSESRFWYNLE